MITLFNPDIILQFAMKMSSSVWRVVCVSQPAGSVMATAMAVVTTVTRRRQNAVSLALAYLLPLFIKFYLSHFPAVRKRQEAEEALEDFGV